MSLAASSGFLLYVGLCQALPAEEPPVFLEEAERYPPWEFFQERQEIIRAQQHYLVTLLHMEARREQELFHYLMELEERKTTLALLLDATNPCYGTAYRLQCLRKYRNIVGMELYYGGYYPEAVPWWQPRPIDPFYLRSHSK